MALITLIRRGRTPARRGPSSCWPALGIFGASLFFGDSMITPAISVLSAVEGLKVAAPSLEHLDRPDHGGDHRRAVPAAAVRHGGGGAAVRPGDDRLVPGHRARAGSTASPSTRDPQGAVADLRAGFLLQPLLDRVLRAGRGRARGHRRRGAVRGHGALRALADHPRLAAPRVPGVHPQLHGPGRADPRRPAPTSAARSSCSSPTGGGCRWSSWPRPRPSSRRRPSSPARSRSPPRPSSSATCRGCGSRTPRRRRSGRSTCRGSTGC